MTTTVKVPAQRSGADAPTLILPAGMSLSQPKVDDRAGRGRVYGRVPMAAIVPAAAVPPAPQGCRSWCSPGHSDLVVGESDRDCHTDAPNTDGGELHLSQHRGSRNRLGTGRLVIGMRQAPAEVDPRIEIGRFINGDKDGTWLRLTVREAECLAGTLAAAGELAAQPLPAEPATAGSAWWQTTTCPGWCLIEHIPGEDYADRHHIGASASMPLLLDDGRDGEPTYLDVTPVQHYRSHAGLVEVVKDSPRGGLVFLTPLEAATLAGHLLDLVALADADAGRGAR